MARALSFLPGHDATGTACVAHKPSPFPPSAGPFRFPGVIDDHEHQVLNYRLFRYSHFLTPASNKPAKMSKRGHVKSQTEAFLTVPPPLQLSTSIS
jgi:hypothetical protein